MTPDEKKASDRKSAKKTYDLINKQKQASAPFGNIQKRHGKGKGGPKPINNDDYERLKNLTQRKNYKTKFSEKHKPVDYGNKPASRAGWGGGAGEYQWTKDPEDLYK